MSRATGRWALAVAAAGTLGLAAACGADATAKATDAPGVRAALSFAPDPPVARRAEAVRATLSAPDGSPLAAGRVTLRASMPAMPGMPGPGAVTLQPAAPGVYTGSVILLMGGRWSAQLSVDRGAGLPAATLTLPFEVRD